MLQNYHSSRNFTSFRPATTFQAAGKAKVAAKAANLSTVEIVERHFGKHTGLPHSTKACPIHARRETGCKAGSWGQASSTAPTTTSRRWLQKLQ
jgi:hypothetical protein